MKPGAYTIQNLGELETFVGKLVLDLQSTPKPFYLLLTGQLGAGKTTLTKLLLKKMGVQTPVTSPTFVVLNHYETTTGQINHMDAYRLTPNQELEMYFESFEHSFNIIEWPENLGVDWTNYQTLKLTLTIIDDNQRKIVVE